MAASEPSGGGGGNIEVCPWLKSMPLAPEYHPTLAEFQDPIAYIFKIEKEASKYGICKIVPPVASAPRKTILANFNKSLLSRSNDPTFTTRQQQIGFCPRKHRPVQKPVWQSGERYTLSEFEAKAKNFERNYLRKYVKKTLNPLELETLYWNATVDKPFAVEYANDMPGSAFAVRKSGGKKVGEGAMTVGDTEWNMRGMSRANTSLLKFMKEEIPGVTSPMVYVAMLFSWFAWHVEDHDFHSLNYLHMGSSKTWYGVPKDAAVAFEEVVREHGYAGEINPLVMFSKLGEKTTVMSPEVLLGAGVPCCRLVQNAGDFVVTFPRAYHSGFSHGFNCGEASNIATPEWLRVAKEAAVRRASINCPPMVSHFQLLYDLALSLCSRIPKNVIMEPRSSRLKNRKKSEGEMLIKEMFLQDMMQNNELLHELGKGTSVVLLSQNSLSSSVYSDSRTGKHLSAKSRLFPSLCNPEDEFMTTKYDARDDFMRERKLGMKQTDDYAASGKISSRSGNITEQLDSKRISQTEQGLFSCVTCGILCFSCVAILQPTEAASHHLMSADCSKLDDWEVSGSEHNDASDTNAPTMNPYSVLELLKIQDGRYSAPMSSVRDLGDGTAGTAPNSRVSKGPSSLGLLALAYGDSSDTEGDEAEEDIPPKGCGTSESNSDNELRGDSQTFDSSDEFRASNCTVVESNSLTRRYEHQGQGNFHSMAASDNYHATSGNDLTPLENRSRSFSSRSDEDSSRLHIFCLQHAVEVEKRLSSIGGAHVFLVCHPDYPKLEYEVKKVAEELESDHLWNEVSFRDATSEDEDLIQLALNSENAIHGNGDWAVKLGINLFYSANLSRSPLYCKQMPYNSVMYSAFGRGSPNEDHTANMDLEGRGSSRQRKIIVAGKWCGKVWMSNQVHPLLVKKDLDEQEQEFGVSSGVKPDVTYQRRSVSRAVGMTPRAPTTKKTSRKRKNTRGNGSFVKENSVDTQTMEDPSEDFVPSYSRKKVNRKRGKKQLKKEIHEAEHLDESSEEVEPITFKQFKKGKRETKHLKTEFLPVNENSEESSEEYPLTNSWKPVKSRNVPRGMEMENPEPEFSDESLEELETQGRRGTKLLKNEDPDSENSEDSSEEIPLTNSWIQTKAKGRRTARVTPAPQGKTPKTKQQFDPLTDDDELAGGPSTRLRKRAKKPCPDLVAKLAKVKPVPKQQQKGKAVKKGKASAVSNKASNMEEEAEYQCDVEGCNMSFSSKHELTLHKRNICPVRGCGKKFFSHKYLVQHRRVHEDDRPLKCPWKGCKMTFKWAWARTEHIRVHTGARPYVCTQAGCGQTFRFVSDFSRHKRKTGHAPKKSARGDR